MSLIRAIDCVRRKDECIAFYLDLPFHPADPAYDKFKTKFGWGPRDDIKQILNKYFTDYVIGFEYSKEKNIPHVHVFTFDTGKKYQAFRSFIVKRYNLIGRSTANVRRQYGKIKGILREPLNMISYTIKHNDYDTHGFCRDFLKRYQERSYIKEETDIDKFQTLIKSVHRMYNGPEVLPDLEFLTWISKKYGEIFNKPITPSQANKILYNAGILTDKMLVHINFRTYLNARVHDFPNTDLRMRHMFPDESILLSNHILESCPTAEEFAPGAGDGK